MATFTPDKNKKNEETKPNFKSLNKWCIKFGMWGTTVEGISTTTLSSFIA